MIDFLKISSLAIFDEISIEFGEGLNCITGETGAGKSLIIGALTLLMGAKASGDIVRPGREKAVIEALFTHSGAEMVLKREIFASGRNRCYINGELATTERLAEASAQLIHIYGQHQYQDLLVAREHMRILEDLAGLKRQALTETYAALEAAHKRLQEMNAAIAQSRREQDDLQFRLEELRSARVEPDEERRVAEALERAQAAEGLRQAATEAYGILYDDPRSVMDQLSAVQTQLQRMAAHDTRIPDKLVEIKGVTAQVEDLALALRALKDTYDSDPAHLERLTERLHLIRDLKRKHQTDEAGLGQLEQDLTSRLAFFEDADHHLEAARADLQTAQTAYIAHVKSFLSQRETFAQTFAQRINHDLSDLGMAGTRFAVTPPDTVALDATDPDTLAPTRLLQGEFMIATNVGQNLLPLAKIASGGELSRIMLAIKVQQEANQDGTLIFDEIDAGISGQTALLIGARLKALAGHAQTIVITHLHQVAALADCHLTVTKGITDQTTVANICAVKGRERVMELARMMGGENPSPKVIEHARELLRG